MTDKEALKLALEALLDLTAPSKQARAAITALRAAIAEAEKQEPVALTDDEIWKFWWNKPEVLEGEDDSMEAQFVSACRKAIKAAAQRPWVGLTDEEVDNFLKAAWSKGVTPADFIRAIEAKLKEKNT